MSFRLSGLQVELFQPLFAMNDDELRSKGIERRTTAPGDDYPCRISLQVARPGESVLLLSYPVQPESSPYRSISPIFVREAATTRYVGHDKVPEQLMPRLTSVRAFDDRHYIVAADVTPGAQLGELAERFFGRPEVSYLHVHHARWGCYVGRIDRA
jgi:hypothetical protein